MEEVIAYWRYYTRIYLQRLRYTMDNSVRIVGAPPRFELRSY
jgi:hypothetical protein